MTTTYCKRIRSTGSYQSTGHHCHTTSFNLPALRMPATTKFEEKWPCGMRNVGLDALHRKMALAKMRRKEKGRVHEKNKES